MEVISTADEDVISSTTIDKAGLAPCNHEEADTRIFVHARHASVNGMKKILIRTVDTDVVILAIAFAKRLKVEELWVAFGVGKQLRYVPIHKIAGSLTIQQCEGLPFFHALTGCDTVSYFSGKGKTTAFQAWKCYPEATEVFFALSLPQAMLSEQQFRVLERFVVIMYSRTSLHQDVNHARQSMFSQGTRSIERIPSTQAALEQHVKRAEFQAGHVWGRILDPIQELPSAADWGWHQSSDGWYRPGLPYLKHLKLVTSSSNVVTRVHVGDSASVLRQTCSALRCAPAMAIAIKSENDKTQLPPKRHRTITVISFFE